MTINFITFALLINSIAIAAIVVDLCTNDGLYNSLGKTGKTLVGAGAIAYLANVVLAIYL